MSTREQVLEVLEKIQERHMRLKVLYIFTKENRPLRSGEVTEWLRKLYPEYQNISRPYVYASIARLVKDGFLKHYRSTLDTILKYYIDYSTCDNIIEDYKRECELNNEQIDARK